MRNPNQHRKYRKGTVPKGQRRQAHQKRKAATKRRREELASAAGLGRRKKTIPQAVKDLWHKLQEYKWKHKIERSKYTPHQGAQECARRRRQMAEGKSI